MPADGPERELKLSLIHILTHDDVRRATRHAVSHAREKGVLFSFDPNLRPSRWPSLELALSRIHI